MEIYFLNLFPYSIYKFNNIFCLHRFDNINLAFDKLSKIINQQIHYNISNDNERNSNNINLNIENISNLGNPPHNYNYKNKMNLESYNGRNSNVQIYNQSEIQSSSRESSSFRKELRKNDNESNNYNKNNHYIYKVGNYIIKYYNKLKRKTNKINTIKGKKKNMEKENIMKIKK